MMYHYFGENDYATLGKFAYNAYQRNQLYIQVCYDKYWFFVECGNNRIYNYVRRRMKEEYPKLRYME